MSTKAKNSHLNSRIGEKTSRILTYVLTIVQNSMLKFPTQHYCNTQLPYLPPTRSTNSTKMNSIQNKLLLIYIEFIKFVIVIFSLSIRPTISSRS